MYAHVGKNVKILLQIIHIHMVIMLRILRKFVEQMETPMTVLKVRKFQKEIVVSSILQTNIPIFYPRL